MQKMLKLLILLKLKMFTFIPSKTNSMLTPKKLNWMVLWQLPSAYLCGVRTHFLNEKSCTVNVRLNRINQNPFGSLYFAVEAMAAELSTAALLLYQNEQNTTKISMLIAENKCIFKQKAIGKISFTCQQGDQVKQIMQQAIASGESQKFWLQSEGKNENGETIALMDFLWSIKPKQS
jgi:hypothetical protein